MTATRYGWVKFPRTTLDHQVWSLASGHVKVWLTILGMANIRPATWSDGRELVQIPPGTFVTSERHLAERARVDRIVVRRALVNLARLGLILVKVRAQRWTLIEVVDWGTYSGPAPEVSPGRAQGEAESEPSLSRGETPRGEPSVYQQVSPNLRRRRAPDSATGGSSVQRGAGSASGPAPSSQNPDQTPSPSVPPEGGHVRPGGRTTLPFQARTGKRGKERETLIAKIATELRYLEPAEWDAYLENLAANQEWPERYSGTLREEAKMLAAQLGPAGSRVSPFALSVAPSGGLLEGKPGSPRRGGWQLGRSGNPSGRPRKHRFDWNQVDRLLLAGWPMARVAQAFGCATSTLSRRLAEHRRATHRAGV